MLWLVGYGSIYFEGDVNLTNLNLDDIVHIRRKEVIVYLDDNQKPPVGEGLNRYEFIYIILENNHLNHRCFFVNKCVYIIYIFLQLAFLIYSVWLLFLYFHIKKNDKFYTVTSQLLFPNIIKSNCFQKHFLVVFFFHISAMTMVKSFSVF